MLREDQIVRYSRQILLQPVGGLGQERLLAVELEWDGAGAAAAAALAYLVAGGSSVRVTPEQKLRPGSIGFLGGGDAVGRPLAEELEAINPDSLALVPRPLRVLLVEGELPPLISKCSVFVGGDGARAVIAAVDPNGCPRCLREHVADHLAPVPPALCVAAGALAALAVQRMALLLSEPRAAWTLLLDGRLERREVSRCAECA